MGMMSGALWLLSLLVVLVSAVGLSLALSARRGTPPAAPSAAGKRRCPGCRALIDRHEVVCPACYLDLQTNCPACGEAVDIAARRCPSCRRPLEPRVSPPDG